MVRKKICNAVQSAGPFSLLADESKDVSKTEQLTVALRYVDLSCGSIHEHFLTFVPTTNFSAESLSKYFLDILKEHQLNPKQMVSQGYDGASVMSGRCSGVQERIQAVAPQARYIHCYAHNLNLALVDCVRNNRDASEFFPLIQVLYVFLSTSKAHIIFMQKQKDLHPDKQPRQLQKLSETRCTCCYSAINAICYTYDALLVTLEDIASGSDHSKAVEAIGLLHQVKNFKFLLSLLSYLTVCCHALTLSQNNYRTERSIFPKQQIWSWQQRKLYKSFVKRNHGKTCMTMPKV